jgi:hypothetical protein
MSNNGQEMDKDTHVTLLPSTEVKEFMTVDAESLVMLLESCGGDLNRFIATMNQTGVPPEFIVYHCEKALSALDDKSLYKRWEDSIRLRKISRLRVMQEQAFDALEKAGGDLSVSPKNALDFAKVILQEFLVQQAQASKNALGYKEPTKDDDAEFEQELAEMEELGK